MQGVQAEVKIYLAEACGKYVYDYALFLLPEQPVANGAKAIGYSPSVEMGA